MNFTNDVSAAWHSATARVVLCVILSCVLSLHKAVEATERPETANVCVIHLVGNAGPYIKNNAGVGPFKRVSFKCTGSKLPVALRVHSSVLEAVSEKEGVTLSTDDEVRGLVQFEDVRSLTILDSVFEGLVGGVYAPVIFDRSAGLFYNCRFANNAFARTGGIFAAGGSLMHVYDSVFEDNKGERYGAVSTTTGCRTVFINTTFSNNQGGYGMDGYEGFVSGAVFSFQNTLTEFEGCEMKNNVAGGAGAGGFTGVKRAVVQFRDCTVENNSGESGALALIDISTATLDDTRFVKNSGGDKAAAVYLRLRSQATIKGGTFTENQGASGAVIAHDGSKLSVTESTFTGNKGTTYGGALSSMNGGCAVIEKCDFQKNSGLFGGALYQDRLGDAMVQDSSFSDNAAEFTGGALYQIDVNATKLRTCEFVGNTGGEAGGALTQIGCGSAAWLPDNYQNGVVCAKNDAPTCDRVEISNCTFEGNSAKVTGQSIFQDRCKTLVVKSTTFSEESPAVVQSNCKARQFSSNSGVSKDAAVHVESCPATSSSDRKLLYLH